ncbi:MAG: hypothetical protein QMB94_07705 [Phycisphaerales bacterium]|jgi:hypothetical protein
MDQFATFGRLVRATMTAILTFSVIAAAGCSGKEYDPTRATRPYPEQLGQGAMVKVQVFRDGGSLIIVNASAQPFDDLDVWVNRQYMLHLDRLDVGETRTVWFGDFFDQWGETPVAGGFFRTDAPTPSVLVQLQIDETSPLLGTVAIPQESRF